MTDKHKPAMISEVVEEGILINGAPIDKLSRFTKRELEKLHKAYSEGHELAVQGLLKKVLET